MRARGSRCPFPHPLTLLTGCILAAAIGSYVLPAGQYERRADPVTGRDVVVAGTYHHVDPRPVGPFEALVAIPKGLAAAGFGRLPRVSRRRRLHRRRRNRRAPSGGRLAGPAAARSRGAAHPDRVAGVCRRRRAREHVGGNHRPRAGAAARHAAPRLRRADGGGDQHRRRRRRRRVQSRSIRSRCRLPRNSPACRCSRAWPSGSCVLAIALAGWIAGTWRHAARTRVVPGRNEEAETSAVVARCADGPSSCCSCSRRSWCSSTASCGSAGTSIRCRRCSSPWASRRD